MIAHKKEFFGGLVLMVLFLAVLAVIFAPVFKGQNGMEFMDNLYNSISKGSAYYIPKVMKQVEPFKGDVVTMTLDMGSETTAGQTAKLMEAGGATVTVKGAVLTVNGDLGMILGNSLADADLMFANNGEAVSTKYGYDERQALYNWWLAMTAMDKNLKKQELFKKAAIVYTAQVKAVEAAYNYYGIEPSKISESVALVSFSLVGYVIYTIWYGFAILFMFEGWGLRLEH